MSWAEYKKKREEQENIETSYSQENNDSNNETSSWQKYKQKREEQKVQQTETLPIANKANTVQKTTTNLTEADLRKIEQNSGLKTGTLNLNKMQAQQQKFENLQQKGNEILQDKNNKIYDVDYIYSDLGIDNGKVFKKSSAFKDGYDFGDITKTVLDTGATLGTEVTKGVANIGENIGDLASYGIAGVADLLGKDEYADKVRKNAQVSLVDKYTKPLSSKIDKNSILGSKGKEMAQSLGYVAGTAAIGTATGGTAGILGKTAEGAAKAANIATTATTFASSMGSGITEAYQNGATDQEALAYGIISGIGEAGSELMFGGLGKIFGKVGFNPTGGALDEVVVQGLSRNIKNKMVKTLVQSGLMATGEGIEEVVSGVVSAIGKKATFMKEEDLKNILKDENLAEQFWMGALTSVIAQTPRTISSIKNKTDYLTGKKWETTQKNETPELAQNVQNTQEQQTILNDIKTLQNENTAQLDDMLNNKELPMKNYIYEKSNNAKIDNLRRDASKYFNNSEKAHNYMQMLEKIIEDKNIDIRFNADLKTPDGKIANGSYSNGVITINPNSTRTGEFIAIHELTHAIGTDSMKNIIETYRKSNPEFNTAVEKLLQNYNSTEITEEALSDVSAQLFGNQEFINNVAQTNPNIFQKIYSEVKYLWHQFRGYKNQNQFIEDLYYKWTQAYKNQNKSLNQTSNYHISENFSNEIDKVLYNQLKSNTQVKARDYTPQILVNNGVENLPMLITQKHIKSIVYTFQEAEKLGLPTKNVNYHGLGKDLLIKAIDNLDNPQAIYKTSENNYLVVTEFKDSIGRKIIVPIQINGKGRYNDVFIDENQIKSVYGRNNLDDYINKNNFEQIYKKNEELDFNEGIQYSNVANSSSTNSIPSSNKDVNTTTKYSIQESENNSGSFNWQKNRFDVSGNENLVNAQTLFYRTRDDGQYYVQATDGSGKITYDGIFYGEKELARSLGEEIARKIVNTSENTNNEIYLQSDKVKSETDYMMAHRPTETGAYASNITKGTGEWESLMPEDVYEHPEWYFDMNQEYSKESFKVLKQIKNNPNAEITIYRATTGNKINKGDWVTLSRKYAEYHNNSQFNGKGNIIELKVKAKDVQYAGDDINEFGYFPQSNIQTTDNPDIRYSQNNGTWQSYLDKNFKPTGTRTNMQDILVSKATNEGAFTQQAKNDTQNNQKVAPSTQNNVLETGEWTKEQQEKAEQKKVAEILTQPIEKVKEKNRAWAIAKANIIDKGIVFEELSQKTKNRELQGKWDYTLTATARGQNAIGQARYEMDSKTKTEKQISKSLEDIRTEVGNKTSDFQQYMYHQLNIDRMTLEDRFAGETGINYERKNAIKNKPVFGKSITADISKKIVAQYEKNNPEFKKWAQDVYDFNNANKQELVKNGVISQELADKLNEMYPHYVPIKRIDAKGNAIKVPLDTNRTGINSPLAKATGGNKDIQPLFETMADRTLQTYRASARNSFGVELMKTLNSIQDTQQADIDTILEEIGDIDSNAELLQEGKNGNNPTFTVFNNGEKVTFEITKNMFDALKPQSDLIRNINNSKLSKVANKVSNFRRGVLTEYNPLFSLTNAIKDAQDVLINSQHPGKTYTKFPEAYAQIINKGYWYNEYVRNGGEQNSYFKDGKFETDIKTNKAKSAITLPLKGISKINNVIEMAPRLAEYIVSREAGRSIETSMLDASRVTTNFKAGGDITKTLNRNGFTFLNASVQGFQQQVRNIQEANVKGLKGYAVLATKYAIAGLPALILNNFVWDDDEDYGELQDYVKDNYYIIGKYGDGKFVRIPKGRTVAVIQKIVNNASEYINENKEINIDTLAKDFWGDLKFASDNLAPNNPLDNNIISPIIQIITNTSWYGEDIVPKRLQDKPKSEQYDETTDSLSIWLGEKLNVSPYKINYLIDQYGGGISDVVLPTMTKQAEDNVFKDKFTTDSVMKNKYPGEFYSKLDELTVKGNSDKATDEDLLKSKYASDISKDMGDLYKEKREIQNSDLPDIEKKEKIKDIQKEINKIAKDRLANVENLKIDRNTAKIGNNQYYKATNTKDGTQDWKKLSEEEIRKNKNISLTTYADYKEKVAKETIKQRKNGTISEDGSIKDKDKITILLNSACSIEEKTALYEQYILSTTDKKYPIVKTTNIDTTQYLQYKLADANGKFDSDKKDDGTVTGKSVSGSAKQKRWQYIENMNITYTQKLILYGLECTPNDIQQKQIVNYVKSLPNKTNKEKLEILSQFKGFTIYKDGRVKY